MTDFSFMRRSSGLVVLACTLVIGVVSSDAAQARKPRVAAVPAEPVDTDVAVDPAMAGHWLPYSTEAYYQLGPLDLQPGTLRFAKGQTFTFTRSAEVLHLTPDKKADTRRIKTLCKGKDVVRSVVIGLHEQGGRTLLQLAFYSGVNGSGGSGQGAGVPPCQTISYTRAQPLVL